ncbi:MAG: hypothetical protein HQL46_10785 [Gammaproteobacteria bacterium]|nr:hypothetical protein [Gammaproteobacteria bacterium]
MKIIISSIFMLFIVSVNINANENETENDKIFPQQLTAQELLYYCASSKLTPTGREKRKYCYGFVSGVEETERYLKGQSTHSKKPLICLPKEKTAYEYARDFKQYANRMKGELNQPAALIVMKALEEKYQCK